MANETCRTMKRRGKRKKNTILWTNIIRWLLLCKYTSIVCLSGKFNFNCIWREAASLLVFLFFFLCRMYFILYISLFVWPSCIFFLVLLHQNAFKIFFIFVNQYWSVGPQTFLHGVFLFVFCLPSHLLLHQW